MSLTQTSFDVPNSATLPSASLTHQVSTLPAWQGPQVDPAHVYVIDDDYGFAGLTSSVFGPQSVLVSRDEPMRRTVVDAIGLIELFSASNVSSVLAQPTGTFLMPRRVVLKFGIDQAKPGREPLPLFVAPDPFEALHEALAVLVSQAATAGADPISDAARANARSVLEAAERAQFVPHRILAGGSGVFLYFSSGQKYAEVECDNDGDIGMMISDRTGNPQLWFSDRARLGDDLARIRVFIV